ncbi:Engulfment and cell motility protein 1 [Camelus dromedarius]|uniref:Engulfment and cell motility protein 1 n=1 Tax=Camelus dromedarius TaxID=9838 RepID=A0A5N4DZW3_CAMDR|nr:Engulfment and cell motility protein 1 [Camelus dromedarius]
MPPPADIVKVAIEWPGAYPKLMEIDQMVSETRTQTQASRTRKPEFVSWLNCRPPANAGLMESETQFLTALQLLKLE